MLLKAARVAATGLLVLAGVLQANAASAETTWAVLDVSSGQFLGESGGRTLRPPASLAKMMTLYLTFEALRDGHLHWDDKIPVSANAASKVRMKLNVKAGSSLTVREAVNGMIVISANDAATAVGERLGGSESGFAALMTRKGRQLGMQNTVFATPSGLTAKATQVTTAQDMARLGLALKRDFPAEYALFAQRTTVFRGRVLHGHNNLMYRYAGVDGIKTGYTDAAGYNLVSSLSTPSHRLIGVVLGGRTAVARDRQMATLLNRFSQEKSVVVAKARTASTPTPLAEAAEVKAPAPADRPVDVADIINQAEIEQGDGGLPVATQPIWQIQVGASPNRKTAESLKVRVDGLFLKVNRSAEGRLVEEHHGRKALYRVRFTGSGGPTEARMACALLKRQHMACLPVGASQ
ncbi:hypothetical protein BJF93_11015 [Xaviernesmea oryzae]|uniref:SPOR domain-containing protein n=1 Tax=Xaviernesmea oryzae TaxID=464029 RepID=A0A1Q9AXF3_9HYPH|nr:D-alanyl-D-alanine carboxypeptidase [Xaviernesmea oryzae]OLP60142.1 hypothetical protein BJF93_11015 [Xaviernesmea oryzae]